MEHVGIRKNYSLMFKAQLIKTLIGLLFITSFAIFNAIHFFVKIESSRNNFGKTAAVLGIYLPVVIKFNIEFTFVNIIRKVVFSK